VCVCVCRCGFCNSVGVYMCAWVCVCCVGVRMYGFCNVWVFFVISVLVFTVFCIFCTVFLYCFVYVYLFLFVLSVLV